MQYAYSISLSILCIYGLQFLHVLYQNRRRGSTFTRALIFPVDEGEAISRGLAIRVRLVLSRPIQVEAGQYVGLWIPRVRLLESHPFVITSWTETKQSSVELFIQPKGGFTMRLLRYRQHLPIPRLAIITGPHGKVTPVLDYEAVILFATDYGITAQIPYLKKLVHGYNYRKGRTRRIRLVWLVSSLSKT